MASPAAVLSILVTANTGGAVRGLGRVNTQLGATQGNANKAVDAFKTVAKAGALLGVGAAAGATKLAVDFDKSMRNVNSIAQLPEKRLQNLSKRVRELGGKTAQSPKTLADGLYDLVSSGFNANQSMTILAKSARAASAGLTTTEVSTKAVAAVLNAYHKPAKEAGKVSDVLFQTVNRGVITFEELASTIGDVLPFASSLGVRLEEVGAATATMTKAGISAPETMTRIKNLMQAFIKPSEGMKKALKEVGVASGEALIKQEGFQGALETIVGATNGSKEAIAKLFPNIRALGGALALTGKNSKGAAGDLRGMETSSGATAKALSQQAKSVSYQWNRLKAQAESLAIGFGNKLLPELSKVLHLLSDPKLTSKEKLDRLGSMLGDMLSRAIPKVADAAAQAAPKVASAFVNGFVNAGVWGQLIIGGLLLKKMGGGAAFMALGKKAGAAMGVGMAAGSAGGSAAAGAATGAGAGAAAGGLASKLAPSLKAAGGIGAGLLAIKTATDFLKDKSDLGLLDGYAKALERVTKAGDAAGMRRLAGQLRETAQANNDLTKGANLRRFADALDVAAASGGKNLAQLGAAFRTMAKSSGGDLERLRREFIDLGNSTQRDVARWTGAVSQNWKQLAASGAMSMHSISGTVRTNMRIVKDRLGKDSDAGRAALAGNFRSAARAVQRSMDAAGGDTQAGAAKIRGYLVKALQSLGLTKSQAQAKVDKGTLQNSESRPGNATIRRQRGGPINIGAASGDSVPAMLERGEYVLNRSAVGKVGRRALDRLNFSAAPRFQKGGMLAAANQLERAHFPYVWGGGHSRSPAPFGPMDCSGAVSFVLQHGGVKIPTMTSGQLMNAGQPGPGQVTVFANPAHTLMRIGDRFFGTSASNPGGGAGWMAAPSASYLSKFVQRHFSGGEGLALPKIPGIRTSLTGGVGALVQRGFDVMRSGAQSTVRRAWASMGLGTGDSNNPAFGGGGGSGASLMKSIAKSRGWNFADWWALDGSETSHGQNLSNPHSSARLRGQFLNFNWGKYGPGSDPRQNPSVAQQVQSMARYIAERYGNPSKAWAFHQGHGFYRMGGKVPGAGVGDRVPAMLEPGEFVVRKRIVDQLGPTFFTDLNGMKKGGHVKHPKHPISAAHGRARDRFDDSHAGAENRQAAAIRAARAAQAALKRRRNLDPMAWDHNIQAFLDIFQSRLALAQLTPDKADDLAELTAIQGLQAKALAQARRRGDTAKITDYAQGLASTQSDIAALNETATGEDPNQPLIDALAAAAEAETAHTDALNGVRDEIKRQTDLAKQWSTTSEFQKTKFIADIMSGQMGRGIIARGFGPSDGTERAY